MAQGVRELLACCKCTFLLYVNAEHCPVERDIAFYSIDPIPVLCGRYMLL